MTNAVDVLFIGGPATGRMICVNKAGATFPSAFDHYEEGEVAVTYTRRAWFNPDNEQWYWIATTAEDEPNDGTIAVAIAAALFPPAWDMRDKPAPEEPEE
jgi:hypothetical protein